MKRGLGLGAKRCEAIEEPDRKDLPAVEEAELEGKDDLVGIEGLELKFKKRCKMGLCSCCCLCKGSSL